MKLSIWSGLGSLCNCSGRTPERSVREYAPSSLLWLAPGTPVCVFVSLSGVIYSVFSLPLSLMLELAVIGLCSVALWHHQESDWISCYYLLKLVFLLTGLFLSATLSALKVGALGKETSENAANYLSLKAGMGQREFLLLLKCIAVGRITRWQECQHKHRDSSFPHQDLI